MIPNPASSSVNVTFSASGLENTTIRLLTLEGICVTAQDLGVQQTGNVVLPLDNLAAGLYMVEITSGTERVVQRLVKE